MFFASSMLDRHASIVNTPFLLIWLGKEVTMSAEENKALIRRFVETVWNNKQVDALDAFHAAEYMRNGTPHTAARFKEDLQGFFAQCPDLHNTIQDMIAEDDRVSYRWIMRGTDQPTGNQLVYRGITFNRIVDGKIVEDWYNYEQVAED